MPPLFERLREYSIHGTEGVLRLQTFLKSVPNMGLEELATAFACDGKFNVTHSEMVQSDCTFKLGSMTVRIMQMHDIDLKIPATFKTCARAIGSEKKIEEIFPELPMPIKAQQCMMAQDLQASGDILPEKEGPREKRMAMLRASCQERFWTQLSPSERNNLNQVSEEPSSDLKPALTEIKKFWPSRWNNGRFDLDHYRQYLRDHVAAEKIWELVEEDIFIITDSHMRVLFVNVENLGQLLFGQEAMDLMQRTIDLWSFFTPLPRPEDQRHVVDNYVRKIHPELDVSRATVDQLPRAKMCIAHLGCWASRPGDRQGRWMLRTSDSNFNRNNTMGFSQTLFPGFYTSVLGTAGKMIRFLLEPLDPDHFRECQEIFQGLDDSHKIPHGEGEDNFLSLFALGINPYTQRHKDKNDITDGMAGLVTLGSYVGRHYPLLLLGGHIFKQRADSSLQVGTSVFLFLAARFRTNLVPFLSSGVTILNTLLLTSLDLVTSLWERTTRVPSSQSGGSSGALPLCHRTTTMTSTTRIWMKMILK